MSNLKVIFNFFNPKDKKKLILIIFLFLIGAFFESLSVGLILPVFSLLIGGKESLISSELFNKFVSDDFINFLQQTNEQTIMLLSLILITSVYFFKNVYLSISYYFAYKFIYQFQIDISNNLYCKYLESNYKFFLNSNKATLVRNVQDEVGTFIRRLLVPGALLISEILTLICIAALLISANPIASITATILGVIFGLLIIFLTKNRVKKWGIQRANYLDKKYKNLFESFNSIVEIKLRNAEQTFLNIFKKNNILHITSDRNVDLLNIFPRFILEFFGVLLFSSIIITLYNFGYDAKSILPIMALFAAAAFRMLPSINRILVYYNSFLYGTKAFEKINSEFSSEHAKFRINKNNFKQHNLENINFESLQFNDVSFSYDDGKTYIFKNLNLNIKKGDFIGISGQSGSGKSTLVLLMSGLLHSMSGKININRNLDILDHNLNFNDVIGYVSQKTTLFDDTIKNNIALGVDEEKIDFKKLEEVIEITQLKEFIENLPNGLNSIVGDDGLRISGGQRQRIAIARALYFDPQLLILDEATSALDSKIEDRIIKIIESLKGKITLVFISHKIKSLEICNEKYEVIENSLKKI